MPKENERERREEQAGPTTEKPREAKRGERGPGETGGVERPNDLQQGLEEEDVGMGEK